MTFKLPNVVYEHILIDNSSTDKTVNIIKRNCDRNKNIKLLINSRNVGASKSIFLALKECNGQGVIPMFAADLQDPIEIIQDFYLEWKKGFLVVFGVRDDRSENFLLK